MSSSQTPDKTSGSSELPTILPLPKPIPLEEFEGIAGMFCYIIEHYGHQGISLLVYRSGGNVYFKIGDWDGNVIPLDDKKHPLCGLAHRCIGDHAMALYELLKTIGVDQALFYFATSSDRFILVDARMSLNKFVGPGMLKDVFGTQVETQRVISIETLNGTIMESIKSGTSPFSSAIILKPSRYRPAQMGNDPIPLYVEVLR